MKLRKTHDQYLSELASKNIKVLPMENYNGAGIKIKHKCICGNIWEISPSTVKRGVTCCKKAKQTKKLDNKSYQIKLNKKNIKVIPLDNYINYHTKIKHKCICGNIWNVSPASVLAGSYCGCKSEINIIEKYSGKPTILYYIKVDNLYKIGLRLIRNNYDNMEDEILRGRYGKKEYDNYDIKIIKIKIYNDGADAFLQEKLILEKFSNYKYKGSDMKSFGGHTELFEKDIRLIK